MSNIATITITAPSEDGTQGFSATVGDGNVSTTGHGQLPSDAVLDAMRLHGWTAECLRPVPVAGFFDAMREALADGDIERARIQLDHHERELQPLVKVGRAWLVANNA